MIAPGQLDIFDDGTHWAYRFGDELRPGLIVRVVICERHDTNPPTFTVAEPSSPGKTWRTRFVASRHEDLHAWLRGALTDEEISR